MENYVISQNAGKIWNMLSCAYIEKASNIKQKLNIEECDLFIALGWLSHDKKVYLITIRDELYLSNKEGFIFIRS